MYPEIYQLQVITAVYGLNMRSALERDEYRGCHEQSKVIPEL
jgi:hypothetical protein